MTPWIRNCWYVIAWGHEVPPADSPELFRRVVLGEPVLVYRTAAGEIVALEDRCCHRHAPLSAGRREGDCVRCGYHGLKFDPSGQCVEAPGIPIVPAKARVKRYPTVLKNNWVFVWMGDPSQADADLLPDNFSCEHPDWQHKPGYLHYDTPYLLICDNLLDFSHLSYVHEKTLGGTPAIARAVPKINGLVVTFGGRWEGVPVRDLLGRSNGFRRPGYAISGDPGFLYARWGYVFSCNVPWAIERNRRRSVPDIANRIHGDAAFADYALTVGVSRRF
jgi:phenylpropionate dioxygenase-like ring-hydroxylating dioxygenase large terminal subunit